MRTLRNRQWMSMACGAVARRLAVGAVCHNRGKTKPTSLFFGVVLGFVLFGSGRTMAGRDLHVPGEYGSIADAVEHAQDGDEVVLAAGTYIGNGNRDVSFLGKAITVRSENPADSDVIATTIVDCQGSSSSPHRGFTFRLSEGRADVARRLGEAMLNGLGVSCP